MVLESSHHRSSYAWFLWMMAASRPASSTPAKIFLREKSTWPASTRCTATAVASPSFRHVFNGLICHRIDARSKSVTETKASGALPILLLYIQITA
ncbi:unnamed protein product [Urochloa humidicola]